MTSLLWMFIQFASQLLFSWSGFALSFHILLFSALKFCYGSFILALILRKTWSSSVKRSIGGCALAASEMGAWFCGTHSSFGQICHSIGLMVSISRKPAMLFFVIISLIVLIIFNFCLWVCGLGFCQFSWGACCAFGNFLQKISFCRSNCIK